MFMKNRMFKMTMVVDFLQTEELDLSGTLLVIKEKKKVSIKFETTKIPLVTKPRQRAYS